MKGHNSVEKFGKIMCISHNTDHIYQCINKSLSKSTHYLKILKKKNEILTSIKGHNAVEKFEKISVTILRTQHFIKIHKLVLNILNGNKILTSIKGHNLVEN